MVPHHTYSRLDCGGGTPSPPTLPRRSPRIHRRPSKSASRRALQASQLLMQRLAWMLLSLLLWQQAIFLLTPFLYVAGMFFHMGTVSLEGVPGIMSQKEATARRTECFRWFWKALENKKLYQRWRMDLVLRTVMTLYLASSDDISKI